MIYAKGMGRKPLGKERVDITLPKGMKEQLQQAATDDGKTLSDLIADLARDFLKRRERSGK
jgi:metal-responsive CopG/Arc/MetJ family transcriptional regulator